MWPVSYYKRALFRRKSSITIEVKTSRLRRFLKKTETENRQEKTEKNRKTGFLSINNTETKFRLACAVAHLHVFLLGYEL